MKILGVRNSFKVALLVGLFIYGFGSLTYENMVIRSEMQLLQEEEEVLLINFKAEAEVFHQCEIGHLKEYRIQKRKELEEAMQKYYKDRERK